MILDLDALQKTYERRALPPKGEKVIGWKKCRIYGCLLSEVYAIVKLEIPAHAERMCPRYAVPNRPNYDEKCRASEAKVLSIEYYKSNGRKLARKPRGSGPVTSFHDPFFLYKKKAVVQPTQPYDPARYACKAGIHFFLSKQQAKDYT